MTHLHMATTVSTIRVYDAPGGYEARRPYGGIITVTHLTDWFAYVGGAVGKVDRATYARALNMLRDLGASGELLHLDTAMRPAEVGLCDQFHCCSRMEKSRRSGPPVLMDYAAAILSSLIAWVLRSLPPTRLRT